MMMNRTHQCLVCYINVKIKIYQSEYISVVRWVSTREVALFLGFQGAVMRVYSHISLGTQTKI